MATTVHADETSLAQLLERAAAGEEIIIAQGETPVARLVPIAPVHPVPTSDRQFGLYAGLATIGPEFFDPLPEEELRAWEGGSGE